MEKAVEIHNFLTVDTRTTSSVNRTKTSQADPRSTSKSIGVVSVIFICLVFAVICLSDMISCFREEPVRPKKKKKKKKKKDVKEKQLSGSCETDNTWGDMRRTTNEDVTRDIDVSQSRRSTDDDITVISHASQSLRLPGVNIHTLSIGKLLFSANKSFFHFPVFTHPVEGGDISLSSFTSTHLSEPLLPSPPRSPKLFRRSVAKDANLDNAKHVEEMRKLRLLQCSKEAKMKAPEKNKLTDERREKPEGETSKKSIQGENISKAGSLSGNKSPGIWFESKLFQGYDEGEKGTP
ncbi:hypothetical protein Btru_029191 [Bulinus truncatus]|nr:hypothetical protein Btru_029191 [Bulinus truncatus]